MPSNSKEDATVTTTSILDQGHQSLQQEFLTNSPLLRSSVLANSFTVNNNPIIEGHKHHNDESFSSPTRRRNTRYDAMDRLRTTFIADYPDHLNAPHLSVSSESSTLNEAESTSSSVLPPEDNRKKYATRQARKSHRIPDEPTIIGSKPETKIDLSTVSKSLKAGLGQIPAILLVGVFHLMVGVPFGVSYFPIGWRSDIELASGKAEDAGDEASEESFFVHGPFPLPGKEALGIRMFLWATIVAQVVFTWKSQFNNPIGLEMVENVPFYHELAAIAIKHAGYGIEALVTLFFMFGIASLLVGIVFYCLGHYELGRIVYFFPMHVLIGCIGGIGLYLVKTGIEVTMDISFSVDHIMEHWGLLRLTLLFEVVLRILERITRDADGKPRYTLLSPIYFCSITPMFYVGLWILNVPIQAARDGGYFFPEIATASSASNDTDAVQDFSLWDSVMEDQGMFDIWTVLDIRDVHWGAIFEAIPTLVALTLFSLIHVPINIPAFGISTNVDVDMNNELIAHGYSNFLSGLFGCGLQNYLAYTQSVVYDRSGGRGKPSGIAVAILTTLLFVIGPTIASFIPKCMAGALLVHVGIDLFLEGVYDSIRKFDRLEYAGIWLIVIVMTTYGMEAAMIAGVIAAVSTYAVQSITYLNPIRGSMSAVTLRSSHRNRNYNASEVLDDPVNGRSRIVVIQLQGHLFFGNMAHLNASIDDLLENKHAPEVINVNFLDSRHRRRIVIMDFSLVVGIDSSAAQTLIKLKSAMHKKYRVDVCIFVTGSEEGFPCEFDLSTELTTPHHRNKQHHFMPNKTNPKQSQSSETLENKSASRQDSESLEVLTEASSLLHHGSSAESDQDLMDFDGSFVMESLDLALIFAENVLIAWEDPTLLDDYDARSTCADHFHPKWKQTPISPTSLITDSMLISTQASFHLEGESDERELAIQFLAYSYPDRNVNNEDLETLLANMKRETYAKNEFLWKQNERSDSAKLLLTGTLVALLENEAGTSEVVFHGNIIGELGLVQGIPRMSSVQCISENGAVLYSLSRESYEELVKSSPQVARVIDQVCIQYLANRVQHVSNRIFETRCLPI